MRNKIYGYVLLTLALLSLSTASKAEEVSVTLTVDEFTQRPIAMGTAERNLSVVLSEINRAQDAGTILTTRGLPMNDFAIKALVGIWAVTPFYCEDSEVVERAWVFKDGSMMVSHIPVTITPKDESYGYGTALEAVVEFDKKGNITDFRFALDAHMSESFEHCGNVASEERQMIIRTYMERFRTAYNRKDINYIEQMFSDDALIITGNVVMSKPSEMSPSQAKVSYTKQTKEQYIRNLKKAFMRNSWINVKFSFDDTGSPCGAITQSQKNSTMYGVRVCQDWKSSNYSDTGYLFLLWEFPEDGRDPIIHVRTWQPKMVGNVEQKPDDSISTLGGFDL